MSFLKTEVPADLETLYKKVNEAQCLNFYDLDDEEKAGVQRLVFIGLAATSEKNGEVFIVPSDNNLLGAVKRTFGRMSEVA